MKKLLAACLLILPFIAFAAAETDTITNWQVYKDGKLVFKSNEGNKKIYTVSLNKEDKFKVLELHIGSDISTNETKRKLLFWQGDKLIYTSVKAVKPHVSTTFVLTKEELLRAVGPDIGKTFTVTYLEGSGTDGRVVFQLEVH